LLPYQNDKPKNTIIDGYNTNPIFAGNDKYPLIGGYEGLKKVFTERNQFVLSKFDLFYPVYSVVWEYPENKTNSLENYKQGIDTIYLQRDGLNNWKIKDYKFSSVIGTSFEDTVSLVTKYDITTDFPGKNNYKITNYPPLTQDEIERNRTAREKQDQIKKQEATQQLQEQNPDLETVKKYQQGLVIIKNNLAQGNDYDGNKASPETVARLQGDIIKIQKIIDDYYTKHPEDKGK